MRWYVLHVLSGQEDKVAEAIQHMIEQGQFVKDGLNRVEEVVVPYETRTEIYKGKRQKRKSKLFPGYILVKASLDVETQHLLRHVKGVIGFIGPGGRPQPLTDEEVEEIFRRMEQEEAEVVTRYEVGDTVKVLSGPFAEMLGKVKEIEPERQKVKIVLSIFGRDTLLELNFDQVERLEDAPEKVGAEEG